MYILEHGNIYRYVLQFVGRFTNKWRQQLPYYYLTGLHFSSKFWIRTYFFGKIGDFFKEKADLCEIPIGDISKAHHFVPYQVPKQNISAKAMGEYLNIILWMAYI